VHAQPFVKWAGGKRSLLPQLAPLFPAHYRGYYEPFVGGGAVFFHLRPKIPAGHLVVLDDLNADLINAYRVIQAGVELLIARLKVIAAEHREESYYYWRDEIAIEDAGVAAARFIYLARAGFNGLWRVNAKGKHNVPVGRDNHKQIIAGARLFDYDNLWAVHRALQGVRLHVRSFDEPAHGDLGPDAAWRSLFVYCDPPYIPVDEGSFTGYSAGGFDFPQQQALRDTALSWHAKGALVLLSNSDTPLVHELYGRAPWTVTPVVTRGSISAGSGGRTPRHEVVIRNYEEV
jgi:DNA adenine methylase